MVLFLLFRGAAKGPNIIILNPLILRSLNFFLFLRRDLIRLNALPKGLLKTLTKILDISKESLARFLREKALKNELKGLNLQ